MGFTETLIDEALGAKMQRSYGISLDERLKMAFPGGVPKEVAEVFAWVPRSLGAAGHVAELFRLGGPAFNRQDNTERRIQELEARLDQLKSDHAALCSELERPQLNFSITPEALGVKMAAREGGARLIADFTAELESARAGVQQKFDESLNRSTLSKLALVIAGEMAPDETLARDLGYASAADFVQGFFPQWKLEAIAKARAEAEAKA